MGPGKRTTHYHITVSVTVVETLALLDAASTLIVYVPAGVPVAGLG
jgi:hypothetical protein